MTTPTREASEVLAAAKARQAARDASGETHVEGSIYEGMEAALSRGGRTIAHVVKYADAVEIAEALDTVARDTGVVPASSVEPCAMGVGCDEAGVCYAAAHGQPERCHRIEALASISPTPPAVGELDDLIACLANPPAGGNRHGSGPYGLEQMKRAAAALATLRPSPDAIREAEPWAWGWYENGGTKRAYAYLPTVNYPRDAECDPFPLYRAALATPEGRTTDKGEGVDLTGGARVGDRVTIRGEREVYGDGTVARVENTQVLVDWDNQPRVCWSFPDDIEVLSRATLPSDQGSAS